MNVTELFDEPGPHARRRHKIIELVSLAIVGGLMAWVIATLTAHGAFSASAWAPFAQWGLWKLLGTGLINNLTAALVAMILSVLAGYILAFGLLSSHMVLRYFSRGITAIFSSVPVLLLLFFTSLMLPAWGLQLPDFWFLVIALTAYSGAVIGDLLRAGVRALPRGQSEAAIALGFSPTRTLQLVLLPQALRSMSPALVSQLVIIFKGTALAYVLGGYLELLHSATLIGAYYSQSALQALLVAAILFMLVNIGLAAIAQGVERRQQRKGIPSTSNDSSALIATAGS